MSSETAIGFIACFVSCFAFGFMFAPLRKFDTQDGATMSSETAIGFIACFVSCFAFGFMFAPLRKFDTQDGFFVQWIQCSIVFIVGFCINFARGFPPFNAIATIGGILFATGNVASVPLVNGLGIGLGMLIWGSVQVTVGWCVARFGLFGTKPQPVYHNPMNITGLLLTLISGVMFVFVKHESNIHEQTTVVSDAEKSDMQIEEQNTSITTSTRTSFISSKKLLLIALAIFLGVLHGLMMTPIVYIMDTDQNASTNVLDYIFAHFCAISAFSTAYFVIYSIYKRNHPHIPSDLVLPSVAYGILWSIGMVLFFISNSMLSQVVSFPITTRVRLLYCVTMFSYL
uniref:Transmembrane protein 144 n=1 Tax=Ascaris lumbricoides TaxID=6252 RepID=A0A0M3IHF7_ASCLU